MADAPSAEARRRFSRLSAHDASAAAPSLLMQVKRLVDEVDQMDAEDRATLAGELSQDWGRLFRGCRADANRARYSIYRRSPAQLQALHDELDALVNP
jgi:hypothetical protein